MAPPTNSGSQTVTKAKIVVVDEKGNAQSDSITCMYNPEITSVNGQGVLNIKGNAGINE